MRDLVSQSVSTSRGRGGTRGRANRVNRAGAAPEPAADGTEEQGDRGGQCPRRDGTGGGVGRRHIDGLGADADPDHV
jgi:hypothetical protein